MKGLLSTTVSVPSFPSPSPPYFTVPDFFSQHFLTLVQVRPYAPGIALFHQLSLLHSFDLPVVSSITSYCTSVDTTTCASGNWLPHAGAAGFLRMCRTFSDNRATISTTITKVKNCVTHVKFGLVVWLSHGMRLSFFLGK